MHDLKGTKIFFTGATTGLGKVAALKAAANGATVLAADRDMRKGEALQNHFKTHFPDAGGSIQLIPCELESLQSVNEACERVLGEHLNLDYIVNNAGTWNFAFTETEDGIENTFQVNVLAPLMIIERLLPLLAKSNDARVINTASGLHQGSILFEDMEYRKKFSGFKAYRQSKLAIILLTRHYQQMFGSEKRLFFSQHPGFINTELVRKGGWFYKMIFKVFGKTPEKGAETLNHLLFRPATELEAGAYYKNSKSTKTDTQASYNLAMAERLYNECLIYLKDYLS